MEYGARTRDPLLTVALRAMLSAVEESMDETRKGGYFHDQQEQQRMEGIAEEDEDQEGEAGEKGKEKGRRHKKTLSVVTQDDSPYLWDDYADPKNGVIDTETTKAFHRIYSAMLFMFCEPSTASNASTKATEDEYITKKRDCYDENGRIVKRPPSPPPPPPITDRQEFGDGMAWCGIALIHLLKQKERFDLLDFSSHLLSVSEWEGMHGTNMVGNVDEETLSTLETFMRSAKECQIQHSRLFELFQSHLSTSDSVHGDEVLVFRPPDLAMSKSME